MVDVDISLLVIVTNTMLF